MIACEMYADSTDDAGVVSMGFAVCAEHLAETEVLFERCRAIYLLGVSTVAAVFLLCGAGRGAGHVRDPETLLLGAYMLGAGVVWGGLDPNEDLHWFFYVNERYGGHREGAD